MEEKWHNDLPTSDCIRCINSWALGVKRLIRRSLSKKKAAISVLLNKLFISGSGDIISRNTIKDADIIEMKVSGSGDINISADAPSIKATISGSGTITSSGRTKDFAGTITGSGDLKCKNLLSENASVTITGSGTAHVYASVHLVAKVTGSGDIFYSGNPGSPDIRKTGSGTIQAEK